LDTSSERWKNLKKRLDHLNENAPEGTAYKLVYFGRHGEGYRALLFMFGSLKCETLPIDNVAIDKYGTQVRDFEL
jgi:hypothetical protein